MRKPAIILAVLLLLAACSGGADEDDAGEPIALVKLATARVAPISETVTLYGTVEVAAQGRDVIFAPVDARVEDILLSAGDPVSKGQLIMRLVPGPDAAVEIAQARSDAEAADAAYARAQRLRKDGLASDADVETAGTARASADALARSLAARQAELALKAPSAGTLDAISANPGDLIPAGTKITAILHSQGSTRARFGAAPEVARRLSVGSAVTLHVAGEERGMSTITSIDPAADPATRLVSVYAALPPQNDLTPGEGIAGDAAFLSSQDAVVVPYGALLDDAGQPYVYVVTQGVAHRHDVTTGATNSETVAIASGVEAGDEVVTEGGTALEDGMKVRLQ
jgi:membrane fusion protein (multidrug efflux system)